MISSLVTSCHLVREWTEKNENSLSGCLTVLGRQELVSSKISNQENFGLLLLLLLLSHVSRVRLCATP